MRQGLKQIEFLRDPTSGELAVGCPEIMNAGIMPAISERLLKQHPRVQLRVTHADTALSQFHPLRERKVELLVGRLPEPFVEDDLIVEPLLQEPFVVIAGVSSPWSRRRRIELADLMEESWVLPPHDSVPGGIISGIFAASGLIAAARRCHIVDPTHHDTRGDRKILWHFAELRCSIQLATCGIENPARKNPDDILRGRHSHAEKPRLWSISQIIH